MKKKTYITNSPEETRVLSKRLAQEILGKSPGKEAVVFGLTGELGAGKTTFAQGFASGLNVHKRITSPTYVILKRFKITKIKNRSMACQRQTYKVLAKRGSSKSKIKMTNQKSKRKEFKNFYHIDCYRISRAEELSHLGLADINHEPKNIVLIEWADRVKSILPDNIYWVEMRHLGPNVREITI